MEETSSAEAGRAGFIHLEREGRESTQGKTLADKQEEMSL